jgi:hypothetical protein
MKRKLPAKVLGHNLWDIEIAYYIQELKAEPAEARALAVIRWMFQGNLHPLADALRDEPINPAILYELVRMINEDRLVVRRRGRSRPLDPAKHARNLAAIMLHEARGDLQIKSAEAVDAIAKGLGMDHELVRQVIRRRRKNTN